MLAAALILLVTTSTSHAELNPSEQGTPATPTVTDTLPQSAFRAARLLYDQRPKEAPSAFRFEIPRLHAVRVAQTDKAAEHIDVTFDLEFQSKDKDTWPELFGAFQKRLHDSGAWLGDDLVAPAPKVVDGVVRVLDLKLSIDASKLPAIELVSLRKRTGADLTSYIRMCGATDKVEVGELKLSRRTATNGFARELVEPPDAKHTYGFLNAYNFGMVLEAGATDARVTEWTAERIAVETRGNPSQWTFALVVDQRIDDTRPR